MVVPFHVRRQAHSVSCGRPWNTRVLLTSDKTDRPSDLPQIFLMQFVFNSSSIVDSLIIIDLSWISLIFLAWRGFIKVASKMDPGWMFSTFYGPV